MVETSHSWICAGPLTQKQTIVTEAQTRVAITYPVFTSLRPATATQLVPLRATIAGIFKCPILCLYVEFTYAAITSEVREQPFYTDLVQRALQCPAAETHVEAIAFRNSGCRISLLVVRARCRWYRKRALARTLFVYSVSPLIDKPVAGLSQILYMENENMKSSTAIRRVVSAPTHGRPIDD